VGGRRVSASPAAHPAESVLMLDPSEDRTPARLAASGCAARRAWFGALRALMLAAALPAAALAQQGVSPVYVDDAPRAADGMIRAGELASVGNLDEAVRVIQSLLDEEGDRLLARPDDPDVYVTVRRRAAQALLASAPLLERYRALESAAAARLLAEGDAESVERRYLLTPAGFEAALRLAQGHIEAARFEAAILILEQLEQHPDRAGEGSLAALAILETATLYAIAVTPADEPGARGAAERRLRPRLDAWRAQARAPAGGEALPPIPALESAQSPLASAPPVDLTDLLARPLWSDSLGEPISFASPNPERTSVRPPEAALWLYSIPTVVGDGVFVNDSRTISAWNRFTLSPRWRLVIESPRDGAIAVPATSPIEEMSTIAAASGRVVALTGLSVGGSMHGRRLLVCLDAQSGRALWSRSAEDLNHPDLQDAALRAPVLIDQGIVVVTLSKDLARRRLDSVYSAGLDLNSGRLMWVRPLGSSGSLPYGWRPVASDLPMATGGVFYRGDKIGFVAAVETANGRVRWIRRLAGLPSNVSRSDPPWEANKPLVHEGRLFTMSPNRSEILMLDAQSGAMLEVCGAGRFDNPDYLLLVGDRLVGVSPNGVTAADVGSFGPNVTVSRVVRLNAGQVRGRAVVSGKELFVPVLDGLLVVDPASGEEIAPARLVLDKPGNVLPLESQLLVVDDREVHSYLFWESAERLLREKMDEDRQNPGPAITYAELSFRAGRTDGILPAVDRALGAIERDPLADRTAEGQRRLFRALLGMVEPGSQPGGAPAWTGSSAAARLSKELRGSLIDRLGRCASSPQERVAYLLASGRHLEGADQPTRAVEAYQTILESPALATATVTHEGTTIAAQFEATRRLRRLMQVFGPEVYAAYQADASRMLSGAAQGLDPEPFEAIARRFPVSRAAVTAWAEAASRHQTRGRPQLAAQALEEGLLAARQVLPPGDPMIGELGGRLVQHQWRAGLLYPALDTLQRLHREHPTVALTERGQRIDAGSLMASIRGRIREIERRAVIGPEATRSRQMAGWTILDALEPLPADPATDRVVLMSDEDEIGLFRRARDDEPADPPLVPVWRGVREETLLWMDRTGVYFSRAVMKGSQRDHIFLRRDLNTGAVLWETQPFRTNFPPAEIDAMLAAREDELGVPRIDTPLRPALPVTEVAVTSDRHTLAAIDRLGRALAVDLETGRVLWTRAATVARMHDAVLEAGTLLLGGSDIPVALNAAAAREDRSALTGGGVVLALDARSGQTLSRSEYARRVRWVRLAPEGFALVGLDDAIEAQDVFQGRTRWRNESPQAQESVDAWAFPGRLITRRDREEIWQIRTDDGALRTPALETRDRLDASGLAFLLKIDDRAALIALNGLALFDREGALVGMDLREGAGGPLVAEFGQDFAVTLSRSVDPAPEGLAVYRLNVHSIGSLKAVSHVSVTLGAAMEPSSAALIDGAMLISSGPVTTVIDMPAGK